MRRSKAARRLVALAAVALAAALATTGCAQRTDGGSRRLRPGDPDLEDVGDFPEPESEKPRTARA